MSDTGQSTLLQSLLMIAPMVAVIGVRFLGGGPASVEAASPDVESSAASSLAGSVWDEFLVIDDKTESAAERVIEIRGMPARGDSPFTDLGGAGEAEGRPSPVVISGPQGQTVRAPRVTVSSVLPSQRRPLAVIDGRPVPVGGEVAPGWVLSSVDGAGRAIEIRHESGATARIELDD